MTTFIRGDRHQPNVNDERGTVTIRLALERSKGNIHRSLTVKDAKVSEVFEALERILFEEE